LQTGCTRIPLPLVAPSCQEPRRKTLAGSWETGKDRAVRMAQKKATDLGVILRNLGEQRRKLADKCQQETGLRPRSDGVRLQLRLLQLAGRVPGLLPRESDGDAGVAGG
jgi:hypothetical protein